MKLTLIAAVLVGAMALSGCASKFKTYDGPEVTRIIVFKDSRKMYLMHHDTALRAFDVELGFEPRGHKEREGDGRTPVGDYIIDRRNPESVGSGDSGYIRSGAWRYGTWTREHTC